MNGQHLCHRSRINRFDRKGNRYYLYLLKCCPFKKKYQILIYSTFSSIMMEHILWFSLETSNDNLNPTSPLEILNLLLCFQVFVRLSTIDRSVIHQNISNLRCWIGAHTTVCVTAVHLDFFPLHLFSTNSWMVNLLQDKVDVLSCSQTKIFTKIFSTFTSLTFCGEEFWIIIILQWHF